MLVLTRKRMESIRISDSVIVTVLAISGYNVRLGIEAPKEIRIHRTEVYEAISRSEADDVNTRQRLVCSAPPLLRSGVAVPEPAR